jgi:CheY-like chemotaxis protein
MASFDVLSVAPRSSTLAGARGMSRTRWGFRIAMSETEPQTGEAMRQVRVLAIEDDPEVRDVLRDLLASEGCSFTSMDAALGAAGQVRRMRPDVILLDLGLPYRPGVWLLAELKADPSTASIPVIILSALTELLTAEQRAMAAAVIPKPFDADALVDTIRAACGPIRSSPSPHTP